MLSNQFYEPDLDIARLEAPIDLKLSQPKFVGEGKPLHGALMYHCARMIEMLNAAEMVRELLNDPDIVGTELMADKGPRRAEAVGVIEAPRGTLFQHYRATGSARPTR